MKEVKGTKPDPYCKGCIHCTQIGSYWGCNYIFDTGHKRPCDPGEGCTAKETKKRGRKRKVIDNG